MNIRSLGSAPGVAFRLAALHVGLPRQGDRLVVSTRKHSFPRQSEERATPLHADEEITLSFDMYECHFNALTNPAGEERAAAIEFEERLMREDLLVASFWKENEWTGSMTVERNQDVTIPDSFDKNSNVMKIRSWSGRLDRELGL